MSEQQTPPWEEQDLVDQVRENHPAPLKVKRPGLKPKETQKPAG
jgi:hypothetical protein